jgi:cyclopropane-fatty-acyl-phospholipid synthase
MRRGSFQVNTLRSRSSALLRDVTRADHRRDPVRDVFFVCARAMEHLVLGSRGEPNQLPFHGRGRMRDELARSAQSTRILSQRIVLSSVQHMSVDFRTLTAGQHEADVGPRDPQLRPDDNLVGAAKKLVADLFGPLDDRGFAVRYWDGTTESSVGRPAFTLGINRPGALRRMLVPPSELRIAEAFLFGDIDIIGDIESAADLGDLAARRVGSAGAALHVLRDALALPHDDDPVTTARVARRLFRYGRRHSTRRDARAVRFHYDLGNDFYALWLDTRMVYSCAYFERGDEDLDTAQRAKLDYVCRKLRLQPGERLLDIGCGWGALIIHAAQRYGVHATGITLSEQQAALARDRVRREGLEDRVVVEIRDYRDLDWADRFDKVASIGMVEHVGAKRLPDYFAAAYRVLKPEGLFLNHGIISLAKARPHPLLDPITRRLWQRDKFITRYVFPDGDLVPTATVVASAEGVGFELRDLESLREHYTTTLRHWVRRLESHESEARAIVGDVTYRVWRLYMSAAAYAFRIGRIGIVQSLLAKPSDQGVVRLPRTRDDLYGTSST